MEAASVRPTPVPHEVEIRVNNKPVTPDDFTDDRAKRLVDREFNLSNASNQPAYNQTVAGKWTVDEKGAISVEEGIAKTLGLKLGDTLSFDIGGQVSNANITSLRKVDWGSMRVNFFVMYPVANVADVPVSYISAFKAPPVAAKGVSGNGQRLQHQSQQQRSNGHKRSVLQKHIEERKPFRIIEPHREEQQ